MKTRSQQREQQQCLSLQIHLYDSTHVEFPLIVQGIKRALRTFCGSHINANHVKDDLFPKTNMILEARLGHVLKGFALAQEDASQHHVHLQLLCARNAGIQLLTCLTRVAKQRGHTHISLHALPYVINYYRRFGFRHTLEHNKEEEEKDVEELAKHVSSLRFESSAQARKDPLFSKLLTLLEQKQLVGNPSLRYCGGYHMRKILS